MNVESTTISTSSKTTESTSSSSGSSAASKEGTAAFKDELDSVKNKEATAVAVKDAETQEAATEKADTADAQAAKTAQDSAAKEVSKDKLLSEQDDAFKNAETPDVISTLTELNSKIATINDIKSGKNSVESIKSKSEDKVDGDFCKVMNMDNQDVTFFLSLTDNQQMTAQAGQLSTQNNLGGVDFASVKSEATQQTVKVSQTLLDALNESSKTNKPFRIDFDSDVSVIMQVDKDGILSAKFIPGSAAVETYLKNNIASLRQSFDDQNLAYNELSYSEKRKEEQQQKQQKNREKENE